MLEITTSQHCGGEDIICKTLTWISFTVTKGHCSKFYYQSYSMDTYLFKVSKVKSNKHLAGVFLSLNRYFYNTVCELIYVRNIKKSVKCLLDCSFDLKQLGFKWQLEKQFEKSNGSFDTRNIQGVLIETIAFNWENIFWYTKHEQV